MRNLRVVAAIMLVAVGGACNFGPMEPLPEEDGGMLVPAAADTVDVRARRGYL